MQSRKFIFVILAAVLAFAVWQTGESRERQAETLDRQMILAEFKPPAGGQEAAEYYLYFPPDFTGEAEENFYLGSVTQGEKKTLRYQIISQGAKRPGYCAKNDWQGLLPAMRFDVYTWKENQWVLSPEKD